MNVTISQDRLNQLEERDTILRLLEEGGVDNWEGYDLSLAEWWKEKEEEEKLRDAFSEIEEIIGEGIEEPAGRGCGYGIRPEVSDKAFKAFAELVKSKKARGR